MQLHPPRSQSRYSCMPPQEPDRTDASRLLPSTDCACRAWQAPVAHVSGRAAPGKSPCLLLPSPRCLSDRDNPSVPALLLPADNRWIQHVIAYPHEDGSSHQAAPAGTPPDCACLSTLRGGDGCKRLPARQECLHRLHRAADKDSAHRWYQGQQRCQRGASAW